MKLGDKITKRCHWAELEEGRGGRQNRVVRREATGTVVYIHPEGRYYMLEFTFPGGTFRECYQFEGGE